ncbi:Zinc finger BED domain-containing protein 1 [Merluccius polli]|uniref:Zinc finger BED domain-containing protein 1 n=1 Tax=Merluccius polli TaxID=89951 RepID=A0AA47NS30_MERPO|nr:Zinc finger BED domain-containing protein 1 [Merluccius polli]
MVVSSSSPPAPIGLLQTPFTLAARKIPSNQVEQCHRAVTKFVVKGLHPFATVETPWFREMTKALNPRYTPPCRTVLSNTLIPAWYEVEKQNVITELANVSKVAITSDGWSSLAQDHYITVTAHYSSQGKLHQKVLRTKAVYRAQTGETVAVEIGEVLEEFGITHKVVVMTVDNASNMDVAAKKLDILKLGCFAHTLNLAAQNVYSIATVTRWAAKLRAVIVWMKRSSVAKIVLKEKQLLLKLPQHTMILDVKTRWNSLFLMVERFLEQYPALQAAVLDPRIRKPMERDRLDRITDEDFTKAEEFIKFMKVLYTSTLCVSSEKTTTCGQILPILMKLKAHFTVQEGDSSFVSNIKRKVFTDLSGCYQEEKNPTVPRRGDSDGPKF